MQFQNAVRISPSDKLFRAEYTDLSVITPNFLRRHLIKRVKKRGELSLRSGAQIQFFGMLLMSARKTELKKYIDFS